MDTLAFESGAAHRYSNSNYILLAALLERLSGRTAARYVRETLLLPLGITRMGFDDDRGAGQRGAVGLAEHPARYLPGLCLGRQRPNNGQ